MSDDWRRRQLGDLVRFASGGTPSKANEAYWRGTVPWVSAKDMKMLFLEDAEDHISELALQEGARLAPKNSVLLLVRGMTLLHDVPICILRRQMAFNQDVKAVVAGPQVDENFLPYLLLGHKPDLLGMVDLAGHGTGRLNTEQLKTLSVPLPPLAEQRAIAHILGTLDDKIELNRRMNETLEAMARALFKSWFVDFDPVRAKAQGRDPGLPNQIAALFPDSFEDSQLGEIPKGWRVDTAGNLFDVSIGRTPPRKESHWFSTNPCDVPWMSIKDMGTCGTFIYEVSEYLTREAVENFRVRRIPKDTVVVSFKLTVGRVAITDREMLSNEAIAHFNPTRAVDLSAPFLYCYLKNFDFDSLGSTSSIATAVNSKSIRSIPILVPTKPISEAFGARVEPMFAMVRESEHQTRSLTALRDALLPKLLSGEVRVWSAPQNPLHPL